MGVVAIVVAVAGCTGGDDASPSTTVRPTIAVATTSVLIDPVDTARAFVDAFADPTIAPSSVATGDAAAYLEHRRLAAQVLGSELVALPSESSHQLCTDGGCAVLDEIVTDPATGRVISLSVDGQRVGGRISGSGLIADDSGVVAQTRTAYVTNAEKLTVVVEVSNTTEIDVELFAFAAVFQPADGGDGVEAVGSWGDARVASGADTLLLFVFDSDSPGGRIGLRGLRDDGLDIVLDIDA